MRYGFTSMTRPARILAATLVCAGCNESPTLPNGYKLFVASSSEKALVKDGVNYGACVAGPCVVELGTAGRFIFGRIDPKQGIPPHPDHAPGFFLIDSATDKATTGLDRDTWLAELKAVGVESPKMRVL